MARVVISLLYDSKYGVVFGIPVLHRISKYAIDSFLKGNLRFPTQLFNG